MSRVLISVVLVILVYTAGAFAGFDPILSRQQLMEETRDAAKVIGGMLRGQQEFDAEAVMGAFEVWKNTADKVGVLFPDGSGTGHDTEAKITVWTDRTGFDKELQSFATQVDAAIAAKPDSIEALKSVAGPVFNICKSCHEGYRVEKED